MSRKTAGAVQESEDILKSVYNLQILQNSNRNCTLFTFIWPGWHGSEKQCFSLCLLGKQFTASNAQYSWTFIQKLWHIHQAILVNSLQQTQDYSHRSQLWHEACYQIMNKYIFRVSSWESVWVEWGDGWEVGQHKFQLKRLNRFGRAICRVFI